jgi:hypothetical protein
MRKILLCTLLMLPPATVCAQTAPAFLDTLQRASFLFFWNEANPSNGLIKDRNTSGSASSIASVGFGISSMCVAVDHGWLPRSAAQDRVLRVLTTLWTGPQGTEASGRNGYKGFFYHFLNMQTAVRDWECELSSIDTALLLAGIIDAKQYFSTDDSLDVRIRALADSIYYRVDWNWMRNFNPGILMGWKPGTQFGGFGEWKGYNEAMILYILALGSPTRPVPTTAWQQWTSTYQLREYYGHTYVWYPALFTHQYSHCWIDFRGIRDAYMRNRGWDYSENTRRATLAQQAYAAANPGGWAGYSDSLWGMTACDAPDFYREHGAPGGFDDGTIAPTAAGGSLPFAPEACIPVLRNLYNNYRPQLWTTYGFRDAFNISQNWWGPDVIGIDEGPIVLMIENYLNGKVWQRFMQNPDIQRGLQRGGFLPVTTVGPPDAAFSSVVRLFPNYPNPFNASTSLTFVIPAAGHVRLRLFDVLGTEVAVLTDGHYPAGTHTVRLDRTDLASGVYLSTLEAGGVLATQRVVLIR